MDIVDDGATAIEQTQVLPYDLIVLDWMLPEADGLTVCRRLRQGGHQVPILMLTARGHVRERIAGLEAGADDYLPKPFDLGELLARVKALSRRSRMSPNTLQIGQIRLDIYERRASLDGQPLALTPREFSLLAHLMANSGRVVPKSELLAKVWNINFDPGSNVIEVHINKLREKLGERGGLIETIRGVGYGMETPP